MVVCETGVILVCKSIKLWSELLQDDPKRCVPIKISIVTLIKKLLISNYNHTLFSLWKTIHQSFSYFCQFLVNLWLFQDVFQMFTISLQAFRFVFCFPGTSIAKTMFFWVRRFQTKCFRRRFISLNVLPGWPWTSSGSSGLIRSKMMTTDPRQSTRGATWLFWTSTGRRWDAGEEFWEFHHGFSKTGPHLILPTKSLLGWGRGSKRDS